MRRHNNKNGKEIWGFELKLGAPKSGVLLGLDGGTTSTVCVCTHVPSRNEPVPDPLPLLARSVGGCSNRNSVGETAARQEMEEVMAEALMMAGFSRLAVRAVCLAVSGVNHASDQHQMIQWLSGYGISARALTAVIRAHDGRGPPTSLTSAILQNLKLSTPDEVIGWTYADPSWARIAALVPVVKACATAGDEVAEKVLLDAIQELAESVRAVVQRLNLCGKDGRESFPLVMVGGVLETDNGWDMGKEVVGCISKEFPGVIPIQPKVEPAVGAAMLAWNYYLKASLERSTLTLK